MTDVNSIKQNTMTDGDGQEIQNVKQIAGNSTSNTVTYSNAPSIGQIVSDGTNNRVLVGYDKDGFGTGKDWGIKVSKSGYDVLTAADTNLVMSSAFNNLKVYATGTATLTTSGGSPRTSSTTITHNLGYSPIIVGSITLSSGLSSEIMAFPGAYYIHDGSVFRVRVISEYFATNTNTATIQVREDVGSGTWTIRYYILVETSAA